MAAAPLKAYVTNCRFENRVVRIAGHEIKLPTLELTAGTRGLSRKQVRERSENWYNHEVMPLVAEKLLELPKADRDNALKEFHETVNAILQNCIVASRIADGSAQEVVQVAAAPVPARVAVPSTLVIPTENLDSSIKVLDTASELKTELQNGRIPDYEWNFDLFLHTALKLQGVKPALANEYNVRTEVMNKFPERKKFGPDINIWPKSFQNRSLANKAVNLQALFKDKGIGSNHINPMLYRAFKEFYEIDRGNDEISGVAIINLKQEVFSLSREQLATVINKDEWKHIDEKIGQLVLYQILKIIPLIPYIEKISDVDIELIIRAYIRDLLLDPRLFDPTDPEGSSCKSTIYNAILDTKLDTLCTVLLPKKTDRLATDWQDNLRRVATYIDVSHLFNTIKQVVVKLAEKIVNPSPNKKETSDNLLKYYLMQFFNKHNVPGDQHANIAKPDRGGFLSFVIPARLARAFSPPVAVPLPAKTSPTVVAH